MKADDYLNFYARQQPDAEFAACGLNRITYGEALAASNRVAHAMIASGLHPGDRVAIVAKNCIEVVVLYLGAFKAGVVPTPINFRLKPLQWREICHDAEVKLLVCDATSAGEIDALRGDFAAIQRFILIGAEPRTGWSDFAEWLENEPATAPDVPVTEDSDALLMYTSGTTGKPRGVLVTHRALTACVAQLGLVAQFQARDRFLLVMPLFHAAGILVMFHALSGGAALLIHEGFKAAAVVEALESRGVTVTMLIPTMIHKCLREVACIASCKFADLKLIIYGASPIAEELLREAIQVFRCDFAQRYGSTETLCLTWLTPDEHRIALETRPALLRSAGRPLPGVRIRVVDQDRRELPAGERGEFMASSPGLMRGYWKVQDDVSCDVGGGRWVLTGDAGYKDAEEYIYLCDRIHDVIISGGENIYPQEIEAVLLEHADICDAAVIGIPDATWGEAPKAIVVVRSGTSPTAAELIGFCRQRLAGFKTPHSVEMVAALPRNAAGKVLRRELREPYWP